MYTYGSPPDIHKYLDAYISVHVCAVHMYCIYLRAQAERIQFNWVCQQFNRIQTPPSLQNRRSHHWCCRFEFCDAEANRAPGSVWFLTQMISPLLAWGTNHDYEHSSMFAMVKHGLLWSRQVTISEDQPSAAAIIFLPCVPGHQLIAAAVNQKHRW